MDRDNKREVYRKYQAQSLLIFSFPFFPLQSANAFKKAKGTYRFSHQQLEKDGVIIESPGIPEQKYTHTHTHTHTLTHTHTHTHTHTQANLNLCTSYKHTYVNSNNTAETLTIPTCMLQHLNITMKLVEFCYYFSFHNFRKKGLSYVMSCSEPGIYCISMFYKGMYVSRCFQFCIDEHQCMHTNILCPCICVSMELGGGCLV